MRVSGESIAVQICSDLKSHELDIKYIRGQRYENESKLLLFFEKPQKK